MLSLFDVGVDNEGKRRQGSEEHEGYEARPKGGEQPPGDAPELCSVFLHRTNHLLKSRRRSPGKPRAPALFRGFVHEGYVLDAGTPKRGLVSVLRRRKAALRTVHRLCRLQG